MKYPLLAIVLIVASMAEAALCSPAVAAGADVRVDVVVGAGAPELEQLAARELALQFERLFDAKIATGNSVPEGATHVVLIGSPKTNPAVNQAAGSRWPALSDQGIVLRSFERDGRRGVIVGGGSPVATLWAAYELGHHFGIRYLFREDIFPATSIALKLDGINAVIEPALRTRTWRTINDFAMGPESWGLADHQKFLKQLAKMKFNRVMLSVWPWHPFVHYEYGGVKKQTATLWFGERFRVDGDTPGKVALGGVRYFENPDFAGKSTYEEMIAAGTRHARGIILAAHQLGMTVGVSISPLEFPREFAAALPGSQAARGLKNLTIAPGGKQGPNDPRLKELVAAKIRAYLKTYPTLDVLYLTLPEFPEWDQHAEAAWKELDAKRGLGGERLEQLIESAAKRNVIASGDRGVRSVKGNVVALAFLNSLFEDESLLKRHAGGKVELVITAIDPALFPVLDRVVPEGAATLNFIDYTARRVVENLKLMSAVPADKVRSRLILTLADDNVGILPQATTRRLGTLVDEMRRLGWDGFSTRYWVPAELDPSVHYLSRAGFDPKVTPRSDHDDLFVGITGNPAATERLWKAWGHLEAATELIDKHQLGFAFPVEGMMMKHYRPQPSPAWSKEVMDHYTQYMIELYRANGAVDPRARKRLFYYAKRSEFVIYYLTAVEALRSAAVARKENQPDKAIEELEKAVESLYDTLTTLGDIAEDQSDRGLIAVLSNHAYRPLLAEFERMIEAAESDE